MSAPAPLTIPYPAIARHGIVGDRRTAALVAADGTIDWLCLPEYDGQPIFGSLLDHERGGHWRIGPVTPAHGEQRYAARTASLVTTWRVDGGRLELTDTMAWPADDRPSDLHAKRVLLRRLRCTRGRAQCRSEYRPRWDFDRVAYTVGADGEATFAAGEISMRLWSQRPHELTPPDGACSSFELRSGDEFWAVLDAGGDAAPWSAERARELMADAEQFWRRWSRTLPPLGKQAARVRRSAILVHLLSYAPAGSLVAAPTTSLPERLRGDTNFDYRYAWIRDASLSLAILSMVHGTGGAESYMNWLGRLGSSTEAPLQIVYGIRGETNLSQCERNDLHGYRGSRPIRVRNHAYEQSQHDSLGYLNDCVQIYLEQGGRWKPEYWDLVRRSADYTAAHWHEPDNGIWELSMRRQWVSGKVMSWVALERAVRVAEKLGHDDGSVRHWRNVMPRIHSDVMERGWSDRIGSFRQHYDADGLDAAALLIPVMGFLPADDPRVSSTIERIEESLAIDGLVHRFDPRSTPGVESDLPVGEFEGAFLPCTFWLATAHAKAGRPGRAEQILRRAESAAGPLGLFAEALDARTGELLGNAPLLFSQIEYVRAITETMKAKPLGKVLLAAQKIFRRMRSIC